MLNTPDHDPIDIHQDIKGLMDLVSSRGGPVQQEARKLSRSLISLHVSVTVTESHQIAFGKIVRYHSSVELIDSSEMDDQTATDIGQFKISMCSSSNHRGEPIGSSTIVANWHDEARGAIRVAGTINAFDGAIAWEGAVDSDTPTRWENVIDNSDWRAEEAQRRITASISRLREETNN